MLRSTSLRLAALYTCIFAIAVVLLGVITLSATRAALDRQFEERIQSDAAALAQEYKSEGLRGLLEAIRERDETPSALHYGLEAPGGKQLAGRLNAQMQPTGWSTSEVSQSNGEPETLRIFVVDLHDGYRIVVGDDEDSTQILKRVLVSAFAWALLGVVLLGALGGYALSRNMHRRLTAISSTAEAIIDGDLGSRVPVAGDSDDIDRLAMTFNRMLDRISDLMQSLRHVTNNVAHDLRTPLTRLRQRLESQKNSEDNHDLIDAALGDLDGILATFSALLRIAEIESGARRAAFEPIDLALLAGRVVDDFAPSAEEAGQSLSLEASGHFMVDGDSELLTQMIVNLVENSMRHAGSSAKIVVRVKSHQYGRTLSVIDNGPGIPKAEREHIFDRFYRLEDSRSTPGSGLGLSLVSAIARLHNAKISLHDAIPGLETRIKFPAA